MHTIESILETKGQQVVSIDADATVLEAAELMNQRHIGAVVVTRGEKVVGIFTERDVMNRVVAKRRDPQKTVIRDVMTAPVACCSPKSTRSECRAVMKGRRIRHLPVVDQQDRLMGIVSIGDLLQDEGEEQDQTIRYLYEYMIVNWS